MNIKIFRKKILILTLITAIMSNIIFPVINKTAILKNDISGEIKTISENNNEIKLSIYSENEIRNELKKAGVNNKSIEAFIATNNFKKRKVSEKEIAQIKEGLLKAIKFDSKNYLALVALGYIISTFSMNDEEKSCYEAIPYFEKAIKVNPEFEQAYTYLIHVYSNLSNDEHDTKKFNDLLEKRKFFSEQLIKLYPESPEGYDSLYACYSDTGNYDMAITTANKAIELYFKNKENKRYYFEVMSGYDTDDYENTNEYIGNMLEFALLTVYLDKGDDKATFDYFFKIYEKKRRYPDKYEGVKSNLTGRIKDLNEKYRNTDKKLYEENLRKFKTLKL